MRCHLLLFESFYLFKGIFLTTKPHVFTIIFYMVLFVSGAYVLHCGFESKIIPAQYHYIHHLR